MCHPAIRPPSDKAYLARPAAPIVYYTKPGCGPRSVCIALFDPKTFNLPPDSAHVGCGIGYSPDCAAKGTRKKALPSMRPGRPSRPVTQDSAPGQEGP